MIALDASAVVALLFREPGHDLVEASLAESCLSALNLCEVLDRMGRGGYAISIVRDRLVRLAIEVVPFTDGQAEIAAAIAPISRSVGISLGDRACIALGIERRIPVLTADRVWGLIDLGVDVRLIR